MAKVNELGTQLDESNGKMGEMVTSMGEIEKSFQRNQQDNRNYQPDSFTD